MTKYTILTLTALGLSAQNTTTASLSGRVTDPSAAGVPEASVTLTRLGTNEVQRAKTDAEGRYVFNRVIPAGYGIDVEKTGFRKVKLEAVLAVNDSLTQDVRLQVGDVAETITVNDVPTGVQNRGAGVSLAVDARSVSQLPLNGRDWSKLIALAPGGGLTANAPVSGVRNSFNSITIDGVGNNNERSSGPPLAGGAAAYSGPNLISTEAVQEFRVITSNADATFGRGSGAQVNVITKSGTNALHGSAYGFLRNNALDARDFFNSGPFFDDRGRAVAPPLRQQLFGATAGGPIQRDRHFYFVSYEGFRQKRQATTAFTFPNTDLIGLIPGDLGRLYRTYYADRGLVASTTGPGEFRPLTPATRAAAVEAGFDPRLFDGATANGEAGTLLQSTTVPQDLDHNAVLIRTDHILSPRWRVSGRFGHAKPVLVAPQFGSVSPIDLYTETRRWRSYTGEVVGALTTAQVLEVRGGWLRTEFTQLPPDGVGERFRAIGVPDVGVSVNPVGTGLNSLGLLGTSATAFLDNQSIPQVSALHTWQRGKVTLRSGLDITAFVIDIHNGQGRPGYTFTGFVGANGILGARPGQPQAVATSAAASVFGVGGGPTSALRQYTSSRQEYFHQADIRLLRNLTLNLGVRYTFTSVYRESSNATSNLYAVNSSGALDKSVHPFTFGRTANRIEPIGGEMYRPDRNNLQPRIGFAWDVSGRGTTVVRAAYGAYDDRFFQLIFSAQGGLVNNPPFALASNAANVPYRLGSELPVVTSTPSVFGVDPTLRSPRVHRVSAGMERELWPSTTFSADYVGTFGRGLVGVADVNGGGGVPAALRPDLRFSTMRLIGNTSASDYHAFQAVARQRYRSGLSFSIAYTLADAKDDSSSEAFAIFPGLVNRGASPAPGFQGGGAQNWVDRPRSADWGAGAGTSRHTLVASHVWELPFGRQRLWLRSLPRLADALVGGWNLSGILAIRSGDVVDLQLGSDANDDGDLIDRPRLVAGSLNDLRASGGEKTQFYRSREGATQILGPTPTPADPFSVVPRNALRGPSIWFYDAALAKRVAITERVSLSFEANAFNLFNRANFANPVATLSDARFGRIVGTAAGTTPRQIQLGLKILF